jgi:1-acyl-sn-glycerol-3-phosphate acyltransferase
MSRWRIRLRASWQLLRVLIHILGGVWTISRVFPKLNPAQREARVQAWAQRMLAHFGIELVVQGQAPVRGPVLLAANHISWLDIVVIHAARHCRFVSKSELQAWPLIGTLATGAGTLFIERSSRRDAMRVVQHMTERLGTGDVLAIFPEGTTSDGLSLLPFHGNLFQAAIAANAPVLPMALRFTDVRSGAHSLTPCYVGDDTLMASIWRTLCNPGIAAVVTFGEPQHAQGRNRRAWAADLQQTISAMRAG